MTKALIAMATDSLSIRLTPTIAQTADPIAPETTVCDGEIGEALGLCNIYCVTLGCDVRRAETDRETCDSPAADFFEAAQRRIHRGTTMCLARAERRYRQ